MRSHWAVENSLHWVMDMVFRDDECRIRTEHAPANFTTIKHMAHNLIRRAPGKDSLRLRRKVAAWDDDFLASLIDRHEFLHPIPLPSDHTDLLRRGAGEHCPDRATERRMDPIRGHIPERAEHESPEMRAGMG